MIMNGLVLLAIITHLYSIPIISCAGIMKGRRSPRSNALNKLASE